MITALLTRRVFLALGGAQWRIIFTHRVLLEIEVSTGMDILAGALDLRRCSAATLKAVLGALGIPPAAVRSASDAGIAQRVLLDGWSASMPDPEPRADNEREKTVPNWTEAWARARELGLADAEWLDMTPRMVHAVATERLERIRQKEFMMSRLTAITANFSMCAPKTPFEDDHFMLRPWPKKEQELPPVTGEYLMGIFAPFRAEQ